MDISNNIIQLGTTSIKKCTHILPYSTVTFKRGGLGLGVSLGIEGDLSIIKILSELPTITTVDLIYSKLSQLKDYSTIEAVIETEENNEKKVFKFDNNKVSPIQREGFNVILFLVNNQVIGYTIFPSVIASSNNYQGFNYFLNRYFFVNGVDIIINDTNKISEIEEGTNAITLRSDLEILVSELNCSGNENYQYVTNKEIKLSPTSGNYGTHVFSAANDIFTNCLYCNIKENQFIKLGLNKNIYLPLNELDKEQLGFLENDPVVYLWRDDNSYAIFSLTKKLPGIPSTNVTYPLPYTLPDEDDYTYVHKLDGLEGESINYFAGRYLITTLGRVLDVLTEEFLEKENTERFFVDRLDLNKNKRLILKSNKWGSYSKVVEEIEDISNTYINIEKSIMNKSSIVGKIGDWFILEERVDSSVIYTNLNICIKLQQGEEDPIIVNNKAIILKETSENSTTYTLYDKPGYYISRAYYNYINKSNDANTYSDFDSWEENYKVSNKKVTLITKTSDDRSVSDPIEIQRSFFSEFRRNTLPNTLDNFEIIGAFCGIIFYRIGNIVNFL